MREYATLDTSGALAQSMTVAALSALLSAIADDGIPNGSGVPSGSPSSNGWPLPWYKDNTAVTGGLYHWDSAAWVEDAVIL